MLFILLACATESSPLGSEPPLGEGSWNDTAVEDTAGSDTDTATDTGSDDTSTVDTGSDDTGEEDTSTADTGSDTAEATETGTVEDTGTEDTASCAGLIIDSTSVSGTAHGYGASMYSEFSKTFHITGCATHVTAHNGCGGDSSAWFDVSWPGASAAATTSGGCTFGGRDEALLDDAGIGVDGEVDTEVTLVVTGYGYVDPITWTETTIDSDQGTLSIRVDFD